MIKRKMKKMKDNLKEEYDLMKKQDKPIIGVVVPEEPDREQKRRDLVNKYIDAFHSKSEKEFRDIPFGEVPWPYTIDELDSLIKALVERPHDYGTCVYAMSYAALCAFKYVAHKLGVTGFQAGCADACFLGRRRWMKDGFSILDYKDLLYPQSISKFNRTAEYYIKENIEHLQKRAKELLEEDRGYSVHPNVERHWRWILDFHSLQGSVRK